jgi:hypothetical protein
MKKIGDRVGALLSAKGDTVKLLGYGVYVGDEVPDEEAGGLGAMVREAGVKNPKILLDNGQVVWGCECWWGDEEVVKKKLALYDHVVVVDIVAERKKQERPPCS